MTDPRHKPCKQNPRGGKRSILYIELKAPYPEWLKKLAEKEHRSAKAQAEVIVMRELDKARADN